MDKALHVGDQAPSFTSTAVGGSYGLGAPVSLEDFKGQTVVLYFYPKDNTPGCTRQACGLRDAWHLLSEKAVVFGISPDGAKNHQKFIDNFGLPFPLICDESKEIVLTYGVWVEKNMVGKRTIGVERSTFVISSDGKLRAIFRVVKPDEHVEKVLEML